MRLIFIDGKYITNQVRQPKSGYVSNTALGGKKIFVEDDKIPKELLELSQPIHSKFLNIKNKVYTIDFIYDENQKPWIVELNTKPGLVKFPDAKNIQIKLMNGLSDSLKVCKRI